MQGKVVRQSMRWGASVGRLVLRRGKTGNPRGDSASLTVGAEPVPQAKAAHASAQNLHLQSGAAGACKPAPPRDLAGTNGWRLR